MGDKQQHVLSMRRAIFEVSVEMRGEREGSDEIIKARECCCVLQKYMSGALQYRYFDIYVVPHKRRQNRGLSPIRPKYLQKRKYESTGIAKHGGEINESG